MKITTVGIDLAKNVFQIHGIDEHGKAAFAQLIKREFLYLYVRDDWARIVGVPESQRPVTHVGTVDVNIEGREPFSLNVARIDGCAGTLLKAYPMNAMPVIEDYYRSCFERKRSVDHVLA